MLNNRKIEDDILKEVEVIRNLQKNHNKINIVNAGLLKAGKSELFNAISGKQVFETGVVRTTIENKKLDLDNYALIDTPGLDANFEDSKMAFEGYKDADIIIFVHNAVDGELNKIEIESIKEIMKLFEDSKVFFDSSILVVTHVDQLKNEEEEEQILNIINNQIKELFKDEFLYTIGVDSMSCIRGLKENKDLLVKSSNISNLKFMIEEIIKAEKSCFNSILNKLKIDCNRNIDKAINLLKEEEKSIKIENNNEKIQEARNKIENIKNKSNSYSKSMPKKQIQSITRGQLGLCRSYSKYKSSSSARSAAEKACKEAIRNAASIARKEGALVISSYEQECTNCKSLNLKLMEDYNEIKQIYYNISKNKNISTLNLKFPEISRNDRDILKLCKESVRYIEEDTFKSPSGYFNAYNSNLYIEKDYDEEYVDGLFGGKWKQVAYYTWDIEGSVDDVCTDYKDIVEERTEEVYSLCGKIYSKNAEQALKTYKLEVDKLIDSLSSISSSLASENNNKNKQKQEILKTIEQLKCKKYI